MSSGDDIDALLGDPKLGWLCVTGGRLAAGSGVPQPFHRTRYAPSVVDLVYHHLFKTQSRELFQSLADAVAGGRPPLGFVADTLEAQEGWLAPYLDGLQPGLPLLRLADLAKTGMFHAVASSAPDGLLQRALTRVGVRFQEVTAEAPTVPPGEVLPLFREWDDQLFLDREDRRARESAFISTRLGSLVALSDAVLVVGLSPARSDLADGLALALATRPEARVVWVEEPGLEDPTTEARDALARHPGFARVQVPDLGAFFDHVASLRKVVATPLVVPPPVPVPLMTRAMNASFDVRPVLVLVPGMALFSRLIDKLPTLSTKMVLSLFALVFCLLAWLNWRIWSGYQAQAEPIAERLARAEAYLADPSSERGGIRAEAELETARQKLDKLKLPGSSVFSLELVHERIASATGGLRGRLSRLRDERVVPLLYRNRLAADLQASPSLRSLGEHPPVSVLELHGPARAGRASPSEDPRGVDRDRIPYETLRHPGPLDGHWGRDRLVLVAPQAPLVEVTLQKRILAELREGRFPVAVDLAKIGPGPLTRTVATIVQETAGYTGERASLFSAEGVQALLEAGQGTLYFTQIDAGGVRQNLARIAELLIRFPKARAVIGASSGEARSELAAGLPGWSFVAITEHASSEAMAFLRTRTTPAYAQGVLESTQLRPSIGDPLVLSLLVDYYDALGVPPRSLGLLYDRLLGTLLTRGKLGQATKLRALGIVAREHYERGGWLTRDRAAAAISARMPGAGGVDGAGAVLDELVQNGVLRYHADVWVSLPLKNLRPAAVAKHLDEIPAAERTRFLLAQEDDVAAFYAAVLPNADTAVEDVLAASWEVQALLTAAGRANDLVNPYLRALRKAAVMVKNGVVSPGLQGRLEDVLVELATHTQPLVRAEAIAALSFLATPEVRRLVIAGIEAGDPRDASLLQMAAKAPDAVYVGPIERWLAGLATDADPRKADRYPKATVGKLSHQALSGVLAALTTLGGIGTDAALGVLTGVAARPSDPRFDAPTWHAIRQRALSVLLENRQLDLAGPLVQDVASKPAEWAPVVWRLHAMDDEPTARVLAALLVPPKDADEAASKLCDDAAVAISLMRPEITDALLEPLFQTTPYASLALAYRGRAEDVGKVLGRARGFRGPVMLRALALFGTPEATVAFGKLIDDLEWPDFWESLHFARAPEAGRLLVRRFLCHDGVEPLAGDLLLGHLASTKSSEVREGLVEMLRIARGGSADAYLRATCGADTKAALVAVEAWRKGSPGRFVKEIGHFADPRDLPLLAALATDPDPEVRGAAIGALGAFRDGAAVRALTAALASFPEQVPEIAQALGSTGLREAERPLLALLSPGSKVDRGLVGHVIDALARVGGLESLAALYPLQNDPDLGQPAAEAVFMIGRALLGEVVPVERLRPALDLALVPAPATQPEQANRRR